MKEQKCYDNPGHQLKKNPSQQDFRKTYKQKMQYYQKVQRNWNILKEVDHEMPTLINTIIQSHSCSLYNVNIRIVLV